MCQKIKIRAPVHGPAAGLIAQDFLLKKTIDRQSDSHRINCNSGEPEPVHPK